MLKKDEISRVYLDLKVGITRSQIPSARCIPSFSEEHFFKKKKEITITLFSKMSQIYFQTIQICPKRFLNAVNNSIDDSGE